MGSSKALFPPNTGLTQGSLPSHWTLPVHHTHSWELLLSPTRGSDLAGEEGGSPYPAQPVPAGGCFTTAICALRCSQPALSSTEVLARLFFWAESLRNQLELCTWSTGTASRCSWWSLVHQPGKRLLWNLHRRSLQPPHLLNGSSLQLSMQRARGHPCIQQRENRSWKLHTLNSGSFITVLDYIL